MGGGASGRRPRCPRLAELQPSPPSAIPARRGSRPTLAEGLAAAVLGRRAGFPAAPSGSGEVEGQVELRRRRLGFLAARAARVGADALNSHIDTTFSLSN